MPLFNFEYFPPGLYAILGAGCALWVVIYVMTIRSIITKKIVEMPAIGVASNFAWEFVWSFPFGTSVGLYLGSAFMWGYRLWFLLDIFIFYSLLRYGREQVFIPIVRKYFTFFCLSTLLFWLLSFYFFADENMDTPVGTITAYFDNLTLSALYVVVMLKHPRIRDFSGAQAWLKMLGTGLVSVAVSIQWWENRFLVTLCATTLLLDILYIYLFYHRRSNFEATLEQDVETVAAIAGGTGPIAVPGEPGR